MSVDLSKLPAYRKNKKANEDQVRTSRAERRKNFSPKKWASKYLKDNGGLPVFVYNPGDDRLGVRCTLCQYNYFADVYGFPNPQKFICACCNDYIELQKKKYWGHIYKHNVRLKESVQVHMD